MKQWGQERKNLKIVADTVFPAAIVREKKSKAQALSDLELGRWVISHDWFVYNLYAKGPPALGEGPGKKFSNEKKKDIILDMGQKGF